MVTGASPLLTVTDHARGGPEPGASPWYAIRCAPNRERSIRAALGRHGFESYLPAYTERVRWSDRVKLIERLLFPGYLFVRSREEWAGVLQVSGVLGALPSSLKPVAIAESEIASVELVISSCLSFESVPAFAAGDRVTMAAGPLKGASGVVVRDGAQARLIVSVAMMGRAVSVEVAPSDLERCLKH